MLFAPESTAAFTLSFAQNWDYQFQENDGTRHINVDPQYPQYLGSGSSQAYVAKSLIQAGWPGWTVSVSSTATDGTASVTIYRGDLEPDLARAKFNLVFTGDPLWSIYRFVQVVWTNDPAGGATSPYLDPSPNDDTLPFYYTEEQDVLQRNGNNYQFYDNTHRGYDGSQAIQWHAAMFLVEKTNVGPYVFVSIYDGVYWGYETVGNTGGGGGEIVELESSSPVPEPATLLSVCAGVALLPIRRRRC